jgi:DNA primase
MSRIPEETLQQIIAATDIVDLVGRHVRLRKTGATWKGLCPFHPEKTPSFHVNPQRGSYHCFGCQASGTVIRFLMEHDGLQFMDAVKRLADAANIQIKEEFDANAERAAKVRNGLVKMHNELADWYHELLMKSTHAAAARSYLKSRGINAETARNWKMGYAPKSGALLQQWAEGKKFTENLLVAGGILKRADEDSDRPGETYPFFRHRLMFPIRNDYGEVIAFSGRHVEPNQGGGKYVNSPETVLFNKSKVFFGLDKSSRAIRKANRVIVCEGQLDMITAFEHGFQNILAPLGTAFTEFHARMLKRLAEEVVLCFDSDNAGYKAAVRAFVILAPTGIIVKVAPLPTGEDPDSLIRQQGPEAFQKVLDESKDFFDHMIDFASANQNLSDVRERTSFAAEMAGMIRLLDNTMARDAAIQKVAVRLGIPETDYRRQVARANKAGANATERTGRPAEQSQPLPPQDRTSTLLCQLALSDPEILDWLRNCGREELLQDITGTELLALVWNSNSDLSNPSKMGSFLTSLRKEEESALNALLAQPMPTGGQPLAVQALDALEVKRLHNLLQHEQSRLKQPGLDSETIVKLNSRIMALRKEYLDRRGRLQNIAPLSE